MREIILITGASSGIGKELALNLAEHGKFVYAVARNESKLLDLKKNYPNYIQIISADVSTQEGRNKIKQSIPAQTNISHLVNNAGIMAPTGYLENIDLNAWRYHMSVNVEAPLFLTNSLLPQLIDGRILNITVYSSFKVLVGLGAYGSSKASLNLLTEYFKVELLKHNIAVGLVLPGRVDTDMQSQLSTDQCAEIIERNNLLKNSGELLKPQIVARFLTWLLLKTDNKQFSEKTWDIYDKEHHPRWAEGLTIPSPA